MIKTFCRICKDFTQFETVFHRSGKIHVTKCRECGAFTAHYPEEEEDDREENAEGS